MLRAGGPQNGLHAPGASSAGAPAGWAFLLGAQQECFLGDPEHACQRGQIAVGRERLASFPAADLTFARFARQPPAELGLGETGFLAPSGDPRPDAVPEIGQSIPRFLR